MDKTAKILLTVSLCGILAVSGIYCLAYFGGADHVEMHVEESNRYIGSIPAYGEYTDWYYPEKGNEFVAVDWVVSNVSLKETVHLEMDDTEILYQGKVLEPDMHATEWLWQYQEPMWELQPNYTTVVTYIVQVPMAGDDLEFRYVGDIPKGDIVWV